MKTNTHKKINAGGRKIAIVKSRFNEKITDGLLKGAIKALKESGVNEKDISIFEVPGAFEVPIACKKLAQKKSFQGIVALGAVIKGETAHFDYIAGEAARGLMQVMLEQMIPIGFGIITTYDLNQARSRAKDNHGNKGYEAAMAVIETLSTLNKIK